MLILQRPQSNIIIKELMNKMKYASGLTKYRPFLHFNLNELSINTNSIDYSKLLLSYNNLEIDPYLKTQYPQRLRKYAKYNVVFNENWIDPSICLKHINTNKYIQNVSDKRNEPREFTIMDNSLIYSNIMVELITNISNIVKHIEINTKSLDIHIHQVRLLLIKLFPAKLISMNIKILDM